MRLYFYDSYSHFACYHFYAKKPIYDKMAEKPTFLAQKKGTTMRMLLFMIRFLRKIHFTFARFHQTNLRPFWI